MSASHLGKKFIAYFKILFIAIPAPIEMWTFGELWQSKIQFWFNLVPFVIIKESWSRLEALSVQCDFLCSLSWWKNWWGFALKIQNKKNLTPLCLSAFILQRSPCRSYNFSTLASKWIYCSILFSILDGEKLIFEKNWGQSSQMCGKKLREKMWFICRFYNFTQFSYFPYIQPTSFLSIVD